MTYNSCSAGRQLGENISEQPKEKMTWEGPYLAAHVVTMGLISPPWLAESACCAREIKLALPLVRRTVVSDRRREGQIRAVPTLSFPTKHLLHVFKIFEL